MLFGARSLYFSGTWFRNMVGGSTMWSSMLTMIMSSTFMPEYGDVREDRVVLYGGVGVDAVTFEYVIKATNAGHYVVPALQAESLYDRSVRARGVGATFEVVEK